MGRYLVAAVCARACLLFVVFGVVALAEAEHFHSWPGALALAGERSLVFAVIMAPAVTAMQVVQVRRLAGISVDSLRSVHRARVDLAGSGAPVPDGGVTSGLLRRTDVAVHGDVLSVEVRSTHPILLPGLPGNRKAAERLLARLAPRPAAG
ncbi:hypothetical protein [Actinacidiphila paucisporea]|uniref:hypothetical protein n=1 Tax=Actinacidiphila paucisporea TaxID=310782 RepID=UPI000936B0FD|nr:hypothetical protein [Actinacidiphila paucisporea]